MSTNTTPLSDQEYAEAARCEANESLRRLYNLAEELARAIDDYREEHGPWQCRCPLCLWQSRQGDDAERLDDALAAAVWNLRGFQAVLLGEAALPDDDAAPEDDADSPAVVPAPHSHAEG